MEPRKHQEIEYYDTHARAWLKKHSSNTNTPGDFEGFDPSRLQSFQFCYRLLAEKLPGKKVLDYGCGNGVHLPLLARYAKEIVAIDLSEPSLVIARKLTERKGIAEKITLRAMDCEQLDFPDHTFDIIFDGGTFSSIDLDRALPELARVLKPGGSVIGIETLGHNPIANLKRSLNKKTGKRTAWAAEHIFKLTDIPRIKASFDDVHLFFFHPLSWLAFPFLSLPGGGIVVTLCEFLDRIILAFPPFRRYAFKVVFIFSKPRI